MRFLLRLVLLVVLIVGLFWVFRDPLMEQFGQRARAEASRVGGEVREGKVDLDVDRIAAELKQTGRVVRRKAQVALRKLDEGTRDARTTAKIKARIALDPDLSARDIGVSTTDGRVTLSGRVSSPEDVARAVRLAMDEPEVAEVDSVIQVRPPTDHDGTAPPTATPRP